MPVRNSWEGNEWEAHCRHLLSIRFGDDIQFIPDRVQGDGGLEAFRLDDGVVYQCYAPEDVFNNKGLTTAQKGKISRDIKTLKDKPQQTQEILGEAYRIRRWVLLTPEFDDKDVLKHARKIEKELLRVPHPAWCAEDFRIVVTTDAEMFPDELGRLNASSQATIRLMVDEPTIEQVEREVDPGIVERLSQKLCVNAMLAANPDELDGYRSETLLDYVYGKRQLAALEDRYGSTYSVVQSRAKNIFKSLNRAMAGFDGGPAGVAAIENELAEGLMNDLPSLSPVTCEDLARHFIADWLINCPLRFRAGT
jgi:hypothetical protein